MALRLFATGKGSSGRTGEGAEWRFNRDHVVGLELDAVAVAAPPDPGAEARVGAFLDREEALLRTYFEAPKGKRRTQLGRRIAIAMQLDELLASGDYDHLMEHGPRRKRTPGGAHGKKKEIVVRVSPHPQQKQERESF